MDVDDENEEVVVVSGEPTPQNVEAEKVKSGHNQYDGYADIPCCCTCN